MRKEIITCDRCGKKNNEIRNFEIYYWEKVENGETHRSESFDFCEDCFLEIKTFALKNKE